MPISSSDFFGNLDLDGAPLVSLGMSARSAAAAAMKVIVIDSLCCFLPESLCRFLPKHVRTHLKHILRPVQQLLPILPHQFLLCYILISR